MTNPPIIATSAAGPTGGNVIQARIHAEQAEAAYQAAAERLRAKDELSARAISLPTFCHAEITDQDAAYGFFRDHPAVKDAIATAANQYVRATDNLDVAQGVRVVPGVRVDKARMAA